MKKINSEIRKEARNALDGNWGMAIVVTLVYYLISGCFPMMNGIVAPGNSVVSASGSLVVAVLLFPLEYGFAVFCLNLFRTRETEFGNLLDGYKDFVRVALTYLLVAIYTLLWMLLLIVPGIVKSFSYAMTPYIMRDNPEMRYNAAIEESMRMMKGNKMKLFLLYLSFFGWFLLCLLTLGLGFLLLAPYVHTSVAAFYQDLKDSEQVFEPAPEMAVEIK